MSYPTKSPMQETMSWPINYRRSQWVSPPNLPGANGLTYQISEEPMSYCVSLPKFPGASELAYQISQGANELAYQISQEPVS